MLNDLNVNEFEFQMRLQRLARATRLVSPTWVNMWSIKATRSFWRVKHADELLNQEFQDHLKAWQAGEPTRPLQEVLSALAWYVVREHFCERYYVSPLALDVLFSNARDPERVSDLYARIKQFKQEQMINLMKQMLRLLDTHDKTHEPD